MSPNLMNFWFVSLLRLKNYKALSTLVISGLTVHWPYTLE